MALIRWLGGEGRYWEPSGNCKTCEGTNVSVMHVLLLHLCRMKMRRTMMTKRRTTKRTNQRAAVPALRTHQVRVRTLTEPRRLASDSRDSRAAPKLSHELHRQAFCACPALLQPPGGALPLCYVHSSLLSSFLVHLLLFLPGSSVHRVEIIGQNLLSR